MKGTPVDDLLYAQLYPRPRTTDPQSFHVFLHRHLIPEVREETQSFYGHLDTQEAKYPGLDYTHRTHRIRLSRWPWHRRLFRAFDALGLTHGEVARLARWEGTLWAKQKFEKDAGVTIRDTIDDELAGDSDSEFESVGVDLNTRLRDRASRREAGEPVVVLDEEWEQWLKDAIESGELALLSEQMTQQMVSRASDAIVPAALIPPQMLSSARNGQWADIPDVLHPLLQRTLEAERPRRSAVVNAF